MNITEINAKDASEGLMKGILYGFMALVIVCINAVVIISCVLRSKKNRGNPDIFVVSLAVSSILTGTTVVGIVAYVRATHSENFVGKIAECYVQYFFGTMLRLTDVATTTSIAFDRFAAVYIPIFYRNNVKLKHGYIACAVIWLSSAFIASLPIILQQEISKDMGSLCTADWTTEIAIVVVTVAYIQFLVVLICYVGIFKSIREFVKRQKEMLRPQRKNIGLTITNQARTDFSNVEMLHHNKNSLYIQESNGEDCSPVNPDYIHRTSFTQTTLNIGSSIDATHKNEKQTYGRSYINECFESETSDGLVNLSRVNLKASSQTNEISDGLVKLSKRNLNSASHKVSHNNLVVKKTDKLVQLSQTHYYRHLLDENMSRYAAAETLNQEQTKVESYQNGLIQTPITGVSLKIKNTTNQVSWSDLPEDGSDENNLSSTSRKVHNQSPVSNISHVKTSPEKISDEIRKNIQLISPNDANIQPKKRTTIEKRKIRKSLSTVVKDKWAARKIRRTSSIRNFWRESKTFAKIMGVVVLIFYISWLPLAVSINIVLLTGNQKNHHNILWICYNLSLLSSLAIPIAYAVMCKPYQLPYRLLWKYFKSFVLEKSKN